MLSTAVQVAGRQWKRGFRVPAVARRCTRTCSTTSDGNQANLHSQLLSFPEYKNALDLQRQGNLAQAHVALSRVHEVLGHALGADSPLANTVLFQLADLLHALGQTQKARQLLSSSSFRELKDKIQLEIFLSNVQLQEGQADKAREHSQRAVDCVEHQQDHSTPDNTLFSAAYSSLGIASLYSGHLSDAETYLQCAARWATTPLEEVSAFNNMGALAFFKLAAGEEAPQQFNLWSFETSEAFQEMKMTPESSRQAPLAFLAEPGKDGKEIKEADMHPVIHSALGTWSEGLSLGKKEAEDASVENAIVTAQLLVNRGSLLYLLGHTAECNNHLSEAIRLLTPHEENVLAKPLLGVTLRKVAFLHMKAAQAVTAEGLFNAALRHFQSPYAYDGRYAYEGTLAKGLYGQLLSKWDRREVQGREIRQEAEAAMQKLPRLANDVHLSAMLILPKHLP